MLCIYKKSTLKEKSRIIYQQNIIKGEDESKLLEITQKYNDSNMDNNESDFIELCDSLTILNKEKSLLLQDSLFLESMISFILERKRKINKLEKKYFFDSLFILISYLKRNFINFYQIVEKIFEFCFLSDIPNQFPIETLKLIVNLIKKDPNILEEFINRLNDNFKIYFHTIDFLIILLDENFFLNNSQINKLFYFINTIIQNFTTFEINDEMKIINSLINMFQIDNNFVLQISFLNYELLICYALKLEALDISAKIFEFFSEIISIEILRQESNEILWTKIFDYFSIKKYTKLFIKYIYDEKTTFFLTNLFFHNIKSYKSLLFNSDCFKEFGKLQSILIEKFIDLPSGCKTNILKIITYLLNYSNLSLINNLIIDHAIECFGMKQTVFPEFLITLMYQDEIDKNELKKKLIDNDVLNQCQEYFPDSDYFIAFNKFLTF